MRPHYWGVFVLCNCLMLAGFYWCGRWEIPVMRESVKEAQLQLYEQKRQQKELSSQLGQTLKVVAEIQRNSTQMERLFREIRSQQIHARRQQIRATSGSRQLVEVSSQKLE